MPLNYDSVNAVRDDAGGICIVANSVFDATTHACEAANAMCNVAQGFFSLLLFLKLSAGEQCCGGQAVPSSIVCVHLPGNFSNIWFGRNIMVVKVF